MQKLQLKTQDFSSGEKIFFFSDGSFSVSSSTPAEFSFGADIPPGDGAYYLTTSYGAFVIIVSAGEPSIYPYNYWASRTGSGIDGGYMYANTDFSGAIGSTGTTERSEVLSLPPANFGGYFDSLIDWGDFITLSPMFVNGSAANGAGFIKIDKATWTATEVFHPTANLIEFFHAASVDLGGFLFIENDFTFVHINATDGTVTSYDSSPQTTPLGNVELLIDLGNGYFAATRSVNGNAYIYLFENGTFSYIGERTWYDGALNSSGVNYAWDPLFQIHRDIVNNALYLYDNSGGWRVRKIELTTFNLVWQFNLTTNLPYQDIFLSPMGNWIDTYLDRFSGDLFLTSVYREVVPGTALPGIIRLDKDTGAISAYLKAPAGKTGANYFIRKISETSIVVFYSSAQVLVLNKTSGVLENEFAATGVAEFAFYERYMEDLNGYIYALETTNGYIHRINEQGSTEFILPVGITSNLGQTVYPIPSSGNLVIADYGAFVSIYEVSLA